MLRVHVWVVAMVFFGVLAGQAEAGRHRLFGRRHCQQVPVPCPGDPSYGQLCRTSVIQQFEDVWLYGCDDCNGNDTQVEAAPNLPHHPNACHEENGFCETTYRGSFIAGVYIHTDFMSGRKKPTEDAKPSTDYPAIPFVDVKYGPDTAPRYARVYLAHGKGLAMPISAGKSKQWQDATGLVPISAIHIKIGAHVGKISFYLAGQLFECPSLHP